MNLARRIAPIVTLAAIAAAGLIGAIAADALAASLAFAVLLIGLLAGFARAVRPAVHLREDLAAWVDITSSVTGEAPDDLVNRAVARLRAGCDQLAGFLLGVALATAVYRAAEPDP